MGTTVIAAAAGTVIVANNSCTHNYAKAGSCGCGGGYGNYVWIDHGNGKATIYAHLTRAVVSVGQTVSAGEVLGYVGTTGWSTGPHLHYECRLNGVRYDPMTEY
jgi:murein DD-endopeptidase MepM/ murein hydrolase activator NlpD